MLTCKTTNLCPKLYVLKQSDNCLKMLSLEYVGMYAEEKRCSYSGVCGMYGEET